MKKKLAKVMIVSLVVCFAVSLFAFSASADEVIYNGSVTYSDDLGSYQFPNYIPLVVGESYALTYRGVTDTAFANAPADDIPVPFISFDSLGVVVLSGDFGSGVNVTGILFIGGEETPSSIDVIFSKTSFTDDNKDQVVFNGIVDFASVSGSFVGSSVNSSITFIADREYLVEVNGIKKTYTSAIYDGVVWIGPYPPTAANFSMAILQSANVNNGQPTLTINADNLLSSAGSYPVKITLRGLKVPHFSDQVGSFASNMFSVIGISASSIGSNSILSIFLIGLPLLFIVIGILFTLLNRKKNRGRRGYFKRYKRR